MKRRAASCAYFAVAQLSPLLRLHLSIWRRVARSSEGRFWWLAARGLPDIQPLERFSNSRALRDGVQLTASCAAISALPNPSCPQIVPATCEAADDPAVPRPCVAHERPNKVKSRARKRLGCQIRTESRFALNIDNRDWI